MEFLYNRDMPDRIKKMSKAQLDEAIAITEKKIRLEHDKTGWEPLEESDFTVRR